MIDFAVVYSDPFCLQFYAPKWTYTPGPASTFPSILDLRSSILEWGGVNILHAFLPAEVDLFTWTLINFAIVYLSPNQVYLDGGCQKHSIFELIPFSPSFLPSEMEFT